MAPQFPRIYLLKKGIPFDQLGKLEREIPTLTYSIKEAQVVIGKDMRKGRARLELQFLKLYTEELVKNQGTVVEGRTKRKRVDAHSNGRAKRRSVEDPKTIITIDSSTESESDKETQQVGRRRRRSGQGTQSTTQDNPSPEITSSPVAPLSPSSSTTSIEADEDVNWGDTIKVLRLEWYTDSKEAGVLLPIDEYLIYEGKSVDPPKAPAPEPQITKLFPPKDIISRAKADAPASVEKPYHKHGNHSRNKSAEPSVTRPTHLLRQTTSEHDNPSKFPPLPSWLRSGFSSERPTYAYSPNNTFIEQLKVIRHWRNLCDDDIGVKAYSSAIASIAAYPHTITSATEITRLPKCGPKYAMLFQEWKDKGRIGEVESILKDPEYQVLDQFWNIWGVGDKTALQLYRKGYRSLEDVESYEWNNLSRVQQIGLKYYDELQQKIPRAEVEFVGKTILEHANKLHKGFQMVIVGGYRRGKLESGDVDVILTHPEESATAYFIEDIVASLEDHKWITHVLQRSTGTSDRDQSTVSWKGQSAPSGFSHSGFCTLDRSLVVWQHPEWASKAADIASNPGVPPEKLNRNVRRRVDIIVSPWKTAGCAIIGWSGATTFERDLRSYCRKQKNLKFDSSGVRSRLDGTWIDLEKGESDLLAKEKKVFEGLGLPWREPTERCTG